MMPFALSVFWLHCNYISIAITLSYPVESGHKYEGFTGIIVRIDQTLPGIPLYEVKLDRNGVITFVRMTVDPIRMCKSAFTKFKQ